MTATVSRFLTACASICVLLEFSGCHRNEEAYIRRLVAEIGAAKLSDDAAPLIQAGNLTENLDVELLPESLRAFKPIKVIRDGNLLFLVTSSFKGHKSGLLITGAEWQRSQVNPTQPQPVRIARGLYYYSD